MENIVISCELCDWLANILLIPISIIIFKVVLSSYEDEQDSKNIINLFSIYLELIISIAKL